MSCEKDKSVWKMSRGETVSVHHEPIGQSACQMREVGHVSHIGYVSDTDMLGIRDGYVSVKYREKNNCRKNLILPLIRIHAI